MKRILLFMGVLLFASVSLFGQQIRVAGVVTDQVTGETMPGVTVAVKGTTIGTVTDIDGRYELRVASDAVLIFSFIGMRTVEVEVQGRNVINVAMELDVTVLGEVVVVGYGSQLKYELTGSIASLRSEDIAGITMPSFESALQGRTAGVHISGGSGKLGQVVRTRIRGASSISASNQPLYVIDGVPVFSQNLGTTANEPTNPLADLNPADIESIEVLKDASAAAIYGSRASNGVILVTTKRGREGRTQFNVSTQVGFSEPSNKVGFLNREQYLDLFRSAYSNVAGGPNETFVIWDSWTDALDWRLYAWRDPDNPDDITQGPDVNWEDEALRRGGYQQFDISASGGTQSTRFFAALSFMDQTAIVNGNEFDRINARLNLDQKATDNLSFGLNMSLARTRNFRVANDRAFATPLQMIALPPMNPIIDPATGELNRRTLYENGLVVRKYNNFDTEVFRNFGNLFAELNILPGLTFRSEAGVDILNQREIEYRGRLTNDGGPDGFAFDRTVTAKIFNLENYFTYNAIFADHYDLNLVAGTSLQAADFDFASMTARGFPNDQFKRIASAAEITSASSSGTGYRYNSFFGRANFKAYDRYLLSVTGRVDGSSRFGRDNRYGFFPSASAGYIITNEDFLIDNYTLSFLKPRVSWGRTGNSEIDNFASRGLYVGSNYAGLAGMISSSIPSPDLQWETTTQTNVGIDFGFFNNRISGEIDYYIKNTTNLLLNVQVPATTGFTTVYKNVGEMENKGWEFVLNTVNIDGEFQWTTNFNIAFNQNKVTNLDGQIITAGIWRVMEGHPIGIFYTKEYAGVDPQNGDALFYLNEEGDETTTNLAAAANRIVGDPNPDFWGGFSNTFRYKGFDLNVFFQFVYGHDIYNHGRQWQADGFSWFDNQTVDFYNDHWKEPGDETYYPQPRFYNGNGYGISSMLIFDGSYIRLKEVSLGYTLPRNIVQRANLNNVRVFVRAYNLLTFTDYPGWDPETSAPNTADITTQSSNIQQGWDFYTAPQPRTITFGLNLGF
ncbi:MAG: TonB-dependent receptor [Bacteroidales bacterium]|nr:TonB-dependent receptor [Bacteroidales bacterium]